MMKLKMSDALNVYDASDWLLEREAPSLLAFHLADILQILKGKRDAFILTVSKMPRDENGEVNAEEFATLCNQEIEISLPSIKREDLESAYDKIPVKVVMALRPLMEVENA